MNVDIDAAPAADCRTCHRDMPFPWLLCGQCLADGKRPNTADELSRNRRVTEALLWS